MSSKVLSAQKRTAVEQERFTATGAPAPMTTEKLVECNDVHAEPGAGEAAVFAVAHRQGVVQNDDEEDEYEAMNVLYMTADGELACERWYARETPTDFGRIDRAFVVSERELSDAEGPAQRFAPITRRHPEVRDR